MAEIVTSQSEKSKNINEIIYKIRYGNTMEKYFKDGKIGDISFLFPSDSFRTVSAHKIILASHSVVFYTMFYGDGEFDQEGEIKIVDATAAEFETFLRYIYCSISTISRDNVTKLMYLAEKYAVDGLLRICDDFLKRTSSFEDFLTAYRLANTFRRHELKQFFEEKFRTQPKEFSRQASLTNVQVSN